MTDLSANLVGEDIAATARGAIAATTRTIIGRAIAEGRAPDPVAIEIARTLGGEDFVAHCIFTPLHVRPQ